MREVVVLSALEHPAPAPADPDGPGRLTSGLEAANDSGAIVSTTVTGFRSGRGELDDVHKEGIMRTRLLVGTIALIALAFPLVGQADTSGTNSYGQHTRSSTPPRMRPPRISAGRTWRRRRARRTPPPVPPARWSSSRPGSRWPGHGSLPDPVQDPADPRCQRWGQRYVSLIESDVRLCQPQLPVGLLAGGASHQGLDAPLLEGSIVTYRVTKVTQSTTQCNSDGTQIIKQGGGTGLGYVKW